MRDESHHLSPAQTEVLALLAEECGEVIQAVGKTLRNGADGKHPDGGPSNREWLTKELGDIQAAVRLCRQYGLVGDEAEVDAATAHKLSYIDRYLHHAAVKSS